MQKYFEQSLAGWGNYRPATGRTYRPERLTELRSIVADSEKANPSAAESHGNDGKESVGESPAAATAVARHDMIARGLGRSYGDSATNAGGGVVLQARMDCLIGFDTATGIVEAEGGVSFDTLIELLLPRGFFLPVTPGTRFVTLGGAIAADVHGKNHHVDGTIGNYILSLKLLTAAGDVLLCSPEENAEVFWATVGGMGLTGIILSARMKMISVTSAYVRVQYRKAENLEAALEMFEEKSRHQYSVAWIDCLAAGASLGRCVLMEGDHLPAGELTGRMAKEPLLPKHKREKSVPFHFPKFVLGSMAVKLFNKRFYGKHANETRIVDLHSFFYPLDAIRNWNRIYGRRGFVQYQALFPTQTARAGLRQLMEKIVLSGNASFLAVLKRTGEQGRGMLSFPMPGYTLALDLPNTGVKLDALVRELDEILLQHGGRLYLAKDSTMAAQTFAAMYPRLAEFRAVKAKVDPENRFSSTQGRRVGAV